MADLTREGQSRGSGIAGDENLAGTMRLRAALPKQFLEAYYKLLPFHGLRPAREEPTLVGPAQCSHERINGRLNPRIRGVMMRSDADADPGAMPPFDLQVNGYAGVYFNADDLLLNDVVRACEQLRADGVGRVLATVDC